MSVSWLDRLRRSYLEAARSSDARPRLRIALGIGFLSLAVLAAFVSPAYVAVLNAIAGLILLGDGIILLRLR